MKKYLAMAILLFSANAYSENESTDLTKINSVISYSTYGSGDVIFKVENPSTNCYGYWINKNDMGFNANLTIIIAAYQAKNTVVAKGLTDEKWAGSSKNWCKLYSISLAS
ncbi:hypothetical protein [Aliikangiella sp. G2MR2-5]|uniref:hypothetical protein n=1 Tax=Aliikangiella sp. G2MR2-5 TaxID=2788943 RepID=UPI001AED4C43|nr:hypothetical protein [Aliikangiella sp. G2MR2-5]